MSSNMVNKEYYIRNVQYTPEEYFRQIDIIKKEKNCHELLSEYLAMKKSSYVVSEIFLPSTKEGDQQEQQLASRYIGAN